MDPSFHRYEGHLHPDGRTIEYTGRANHSSNVACFCSMHPLSKLSPRAPFASTSPPRFFYYETKVLATSKCDENGLHITNGFSSSQNDRSTTYRHINPDRQDTNDEFVASCREPSWRIRARQHVRDHLRSDGSIHGFRLIDSDGEDDNSEFREAELSELLEHQTSSDDGIVDVDTDPDRKRFTHNIRVGFLLTSSQSYDPFDDKRVNRDGNACSVQNKNTFQEPLGSSAGPLALAYIGRTGRVVSNGQKLLECPKYGPGDIVGSGFLPDTATFFFTLNGEVAGLVSSRDLELFVDFFQDQETSPDVRVDWMDYLRASVSLHDQGECARVNFGDKEEWMFDLDAFCTKLEREQQKSLSCVRSRDDERKNDAKLQEMVQEYFYFYGYEHAFQAMQAYVPTTSSQEDLSSLSFRSDIRRIIRDRKTVDVIQALETKDAMVPAYSNLWIDLHVLSVVDALTSGRSNDKHADSISTSTWNADAALSVARASFRGYLTASKPSSKRARVELPPRVRQVMALLLYSTEEEIPSSSSCKYLLSSSFREEVADHVVASRRPDQTSRQSTLEVFLHDVDQLQKESVRHGCYVHPGVRTRGGDRIGRVAARGHTADRHVGRPIFSLGSADSSGSSEDE